jgi:hypothetical protein
MMMPNNNARIFRDIYSSMRPLDAACEKKTPPRDESGLVADLADRFKILLWGGKREDVKM